MGFPAPAGPQAPAPSHAVFGLSVNVLFLNLWFMARDKFHPVLDGAVV